MLKVEANPQRNILYITLAGHFNAEEAAAAAAAVMAAVASLKPGFDVISDIRHCHPTDAEGLTAVQRLFAFLASRGVRHVIRVTQIALSALQLQRVGHELGYESINTFSLEEAEKILATRLNEAPGAGPRKWEKVRQHPRLEVGPEQTAAFAVGKMTFDGVRITNLSAKGCFLVIENQWGPLFYEGAILFDFRLEHADLPSIRISAKIMRVVRNLKQLSEDDLGLGVLFLSESRQFMDQVDEYVSAAFAAQV